MNPCGFRKFAARKPHLHDALPTGCRNGQRQHCRRRLLQPGVVNWASPTGDTMGRFTQINEPKLGFWHIETKDLELVSGKISRYLRKITRDPSKNWREKTMVSWCFLHIHLDQSSDSEIWSRDHLGADMGWFNQDTVNRRETSWNKVIRLLSTREKSIKIGHLTWYLQCFVCIIIPPRTAKVRKTCFSSRAAWVSSLPGYVGRRTGICIPTNGD